MWRVVSILILLVSILSCGGQQTRDRAATEEQPVNPSTQKDWSDLTDEQKAERRSQMRQTQTDLLASLSIEGKATYKAWQARLDSLGYDRYVDVYPEMIEEHRPEYPRAQLASGDQGAVWVIAIVDTSGTVTDAAVGKSSGHRELDESAVRAALKNRFNPAIKDDTPVAAIVAYKVEFALAHR